jgi:hypothetical protein
MSAVPASPKVYHITHVENLTSIVGSGYLRSDAVMRTQPSDHSVIGMSHLKQARLARRVDCHEGDCVGDFVPFYFAPRSVMLYLIWKGNHPELAYREGQERVVYLEADLNEVIHWAESYRCKWAFSLSNASAAYAEFRNTRAALVELDWTAIHATDWKACREAKQAEFLVHGSFPWQLFRKVGVSSGQVATEVGRILSATQHRPLVEIKRDWYY